MMEPLQEEDDVLLFQARGQLQSQHQFEEVGRAGMEHRNQVSKYNTETATSFKPQKPVTLQNPSTEANR